MNLKIEHLIAENLIPILASIAMLLFIIERIWPASTLPKVHSWWARVILINLAQMLILIVAGLTWDTWFQSLSIISLKDKFSSLNQAIIAYLLSTFIYYWWHRFRHESLFFWNLCHQLHHSPSRIELVTSFYKHPVEITINSILSAIIVYLLLGCSVEAGAIYTFLTAIAEYFYHLNLRTPYLLGYFIQRPESHRVHHKYGHHTQNYADLPIWDMLFGTFFNPTKYVKKCGFRPERGDRIEDMLSFRNVNSALNDDLEPLQFLPTCIGCKKRWACHNQKSSNDH